MSTNGITSEETVLAERYVSLLDFVSRCAQAVDEGNWRYLWDKLGQLERATAQLRDSLSTDLDDDGQCGFEAPTARPAAVRRAVATWGRHYRAAAALHPTTTTGQTGRVR